MAIPAWLIQIGIAIAVSFVSSRLFAPDLPTPPTPDARRVRGQFRAERTRARYLLGECRASGWSYHETEGLDDFFTDDRDGDYGYRGYARSLAICQDGFTSVSDIWIEGEKQDTERVKTFTADGGYIFYGAGETPHVNSIIVPAEDNEKYGAKLTGSRADGRSLPRYFITPYSLTRVPRLGFPNAFPDQPNATDRRAETVGIIWYFLFQPLEDIPDRTERTPDVSDEAVWLAPPSVEFLTKGLAHTYPISITPQGVRTLSAPVWTDNSAVAIRWALMQAGLEDEDINYSAFRATFITSNRVVTVYNSHLATRNPTHKFGTVDGLVGSGELDDPWEVIEEMLFTIGGKLVSIDGEIHMLPAVDRPATKTLTDDMLIEHGIQMIRVSPGYNQRLNSVTMGIEQNKWEDYTSYEMEITDDALVAADKGRKLTKNLGTRRFCNDPGRAEQLMKIELVKSRPRRTIRVHCTIGDDYERASWTPGERINLAITSAVIPGGLTGKWEILQAIIKMDWTIVFLLVEAPDGLNDPAISDLPAFNPPPAPAPIANTRPGPPIGLAAVASTTVEFGKPVFKITVSRTDYGRPARYVLLDSDGPTDEAIAYGGHIFHVDEPGAYALIATLLGNRGLEGPSRRVDLTVEPPPTPLAVPNIEATPFALLDEASRLNLSLGATVTWGPVTDDLVLTLSRGDYADERLIPAGSGQRVAEFVVDPPRPGDYTLTAYLRHRETGLIGPITTVAVAIRTEALRPDAPVVTARGIAFVAADGKIVSQVNLSWAKTPDRARVVVSNAQGFRSPPIDTIDESVEVTVPTSGPYAWTVTLYNGAQTGPSVSGMVEVSWDHLRPTEAPIPVVFNAIADTAHMTLQRPADPSINALDIRYKVKDPEDTSAIGTITNEQEWASAPRLGTYPIALGPLGNTVLQSATVQATGEYALYGRWSNTHGLLGPIGLIGTGIFIVPSGESGVEQLSGAWTGMLHNLAPLRDSRYGNVLVFEPGDPRLLTRGERNGEAGWPFGRRQVWGMSLPIDDARESPTSLQARWRPGSGGLGASPVVPDDWLADGVSGDFRIRDLNLNRAGTAITDLVTVTLRFRQGGDGLTGGIATTEPLLLAAVEQDAAWQIIHGGTIIDLGGPDHDGTGAVRDTSNPYTWTPQTSAQAALQALMTGMAAPAMIPDPSDSSNMIPNPAHIADDLTFRVLHKAPAYYLSDSQDTGAVLGQLAEIQLPFANSNSWVRTNNASTQRIQAGGGGFITRASFPNAWLLTAGGGQIGSFSLSRDITNDPTFVRVAFGFAQSGQELISEIEDDAQWTLVVEGERYPIGSPNNPDSALNQRSSAPPYSWFPPLPDHPRLLTLLAGILDGTITGNITLEVNRAGARGQANAWQVRARAEIVQPPIPNPNPKMVPAPNDDATWTLQHSSDEMVWTDVVVTPGTFTTVAGSRYLRLRVDIGDDWIGSGISLLQLQWLERL